MKASLYTVAALGALTALAEESFWAIEVDRHAVLCPCDAHKPKLGWQTPQGMGVPVCDPSYGRVPPRVNKKTKYIELVAYPMRVPVRRVRESDMNHERRSSFSEKIINRFAHGALRY